jgi:DNA-binding MarR family transcriptional regulator
MVKKSPSGSHDVNHVVERFWGAFPPVWHSVRSHIHKQAVEDFNITVAQFQILWHIHRGKGSVSDLARVGHISRPATSRMVDVLVNKKLVSRAQDPIDRRHVQLTLTDAGETLLDKLYGNTHSWIAEKLVGLDIKELETILRGLEALERAFYE